MYLRERLQGVVIHVVTAQVRVAEAAQVHFRALLRCRLAHHQVEREVLSKASAQ